MRRPLDGVRVLEVAQYVFVPSAGAILSDWGAKVIKIENPVTGDAQRGLVTVYGQATAPSFTPMMEAPNRGKLSVGLGLAVEEARPILDELIRRSDVFLTNYLPTARSKLRIDVDDVRRVNPDIVYVSGSGFGTQGPDRDSGAYDSTAFWARGGSAAGMTAAGDEHAAAMPARGYGDNIGGLAIAGGVAAALFGRGTTGEPSTLDVSLLAVGAWANQTDVNAALHAGGALPRMDDANASCNPLNGNYRTSDGRHIQLTMPQPSRYWPEFCRVMHLGELAYDPRFETVEALAENLEAATAIVEAAVGSRSHDQCASLLRLGTGPWSAVQDGWEVGNDESLVMNGRIVEIEDIHRRPQKLVANPVKFDEAPLSFTRAPGFAEHTDEVLHELGYDDESLTALKIAGAIY